MSCRISVHPHKMTAFSQFAAIAQGSATATLVEIKSEYGYVVFVGIASGLLVAWQAMQVHNKRKELDIPYPLMYSPDTSGNGQLFNCYQRAHQCTLEHYPSFLMFLFTGGLQYPIPAAIGGAVWILGKVAYSNGYYTGDPDKRKRGDFAHFGMVTLMGCSTMFAAKLLGWI